MTTAAQGRRPTAVVPAELSLVLVHLAVVVGFGRLYDGNDHLFDLTVLTLVAHAAAATVRRLHAPLPVGLLAGFGGGALVATWLLFPDTTALGLPTGATLDQARVAVESAAEEFRSVAAPTAPLPGFQLLAGLGLWAAVWFADWSAFRLRATAEALAPAAILFLFCTVLGAGDGRMAAAVLFAGSVVLFVANHRAYLAELDNAWLATSPAEGARWVRRAGLAMGATVVLAGAVASPLAPGFDDDALVSWRGGNDRGGLRTTVSPIVDLHRRLVSQTNREMFQVETTTPAYWRLTSLHEFDGKIWSSGGEYGEANDELPGAPQVAADSDLIVQRIRIQNLSAIWVPAAFQARAIGDHTRGLSWDPDSATLIVDSSSDDSDGLVYTVTSERPVLDAGTLNSATGEDPPEILDRYRSLPGDFPELAVDQARQATDGATTRYEQAKALQDYFQDGSFTYTTNLDPGHSNDALVSFLEERRGYCEQFSGAYAAMARSLGIPARVAVGFTEGEVDPQNPSVYQVRGVHAHAWPEVYFPGHGWVPFEPTPGRGIPGAQDYTGLTPDQAEPAAPSSTVSVVTTSTPTTAAPPTPTTGTQPDEVPVRGTNLASDETDVPDRWLSYAGWAASLLAVWVVLLLVAPRVRAASRDRSVPDLAVLAAWSDALDPVRWTTDRRPRPSETHVEFARRAAPALDGQAEALDQLAELAQRAAWDPEPVSAADADRASELAVQIRSALHERESTLSRLRRRLSWREAFGVSRPQWRQADDELDREEEPVPVG